METNTRLAALAGAVLLVMAAIAPFAAAANAAGNGAGNLAVETHGASNVTNTSATLNGELAGLGGHDNVTVSFTYWVEGDVSNATTTESAVAEEPDTFRTTVSGLENDTSYVYVAHAEANGTTVSGDEVTFETGGENESELATDAFGLEVSAFVHSLLEDRGDDHRGIGRLVSAFVTANNPGADHRPDHAGPPEDRGKSAADDEAADDEAADDDRRGPPEDRGPNSDSAGGPPEDKGPNGHDDAENAEDESDSESDEDESDSESDEADATATETPADG